MALNDVLMQVRARPTEVSQSERSHRCAVVGHPLTDEHGPAVLDEPRVSRRKLHCHFASLHLFAVLTSTVRGTVMPHLSATPVMFVSTIFMQRSAQSTGACTSTSS